MIQTEKFTLSASQFYWDPALGGNGNLYEIVNTYAVWGDAIANSKSSYALGVQGHLVTITSEAEQNFVQSLPITAPAGIYIAARYNISDDYWVWVDGPESGQPFYFGSYLNGHAVEGMYNNWDLNPNPQYYTPQPPVPYDGYVVHMGGSVPSSHYGTQTPFKWGAYYSVHTGQSLGYVIEYELGRVSLLPASASQSEGQSGGTNYTFTATRTGDTSVAHTAAWAVTGSGVNPAAAADFVGGVLPSGTVSFAAGETSKTITVEVAGDATVEADEGFTVTLSDPSTGLVLGASAASGTILNDDVAANPVLHNGNYYLVVNSAVTWTEALNAAAGMTYEGRQGHLVTITSAAEQQFVHGLVSSSVTTGWDNRSAWIAATDAASEGVWRWAAGPEAGQQFWAGNSAGTSVGEAYSAWMLGYLQNEGAAGGGSGTWTNPTGTGADYAFLLSDLSESASWDDAYSSLTATSSASSPIASSDGMRNAYVVEFSRSNASITSASARVLEGHTGGTSYTFTVSLDWAPLSTQTVSWAVSGSGSNAATDADFVDGVLPSGTVSFAAGETSKTITVEVAGDATVEADEGFTVTLSDPSAGLALGTSTASGTIVNDDSDDDSPTAGVDVVLSGAVINAEGDTGVTAFTFAVTRSGATSSAQSVSYSVTGSGSNPASAADFVGGVLPSGTVSFAADEAIKIITVNVAGDTTVEADEGFTVTLSDPSAGLALWTSTASRTILDDDSDNNSPTAGVDVILSGAASNAEGDTGVTAFTFAVTRSGATSSAQSVSYSVTGSGSNPASAADFVGGVLPSGTVSFAADEAIKIITVNVAGDTTVEADEGFTVTLSDPSAGLALWTSTASRTIVNDDVAVLSFSASAAISAASDGFSFAVADFNGDGTVDVAAASGSGVTVRFNDGSGVFGWELAVAVPNMWGWIEAADIDGDGDTDLLAPTSTGFTVLRNNGSGQFAAASSQLVAGGVVSLEVGDIDGDGLKDVIASTHPHAGIHVFKNMGGTTFGATEVIAANTGRGGYEIGLGDLDGDSDLDMVVGAEISDNIIYLNNGSGSFVRSTTFSVTPGWGPAYNFTVGDLNGDGISDIALANTDNNNVGVRLGTGNGGFADETVFATGSFARWVSIADINSDLHKDLVVANEFGNSISVLIGNGDGTFNLKQDFAFAHNASPLRVITADINGDGRPDLIVGSNDIRAMTNTTPMSIVNDDAAVSIAAASASRSEGQSGGTSYTFTATRSGDTTAAHTVAYAVVGSGANAAVASDFVGGVLPSGTVSFAVGETSKTITVNVAGDTTVEADEGFTVTLSNPSTGLVLGTSTASGTILNDDASPEFLAENTLTSSPSAGFMAEPYRFIPGAGFFAGGKVYVVANKKYNTNDVISADIASSYGPHARIASWNDIKSSVNAQSVGEFMSDIGLPVTIPAYGHYPNIYVSVNGGEFDGERGRFFVTNFTGTSPSNFNYASLDAVGSLNLGSYYWPGQVLVAIDNAAVDVVSVPENIGAQQTIHTLRAVDADVADLLLYSISGGDDAAAFSVDPSTGRISFLNSPDFENPADTGGDNIYDLVVEVSDGTQSVTRNVKIIVADISGEDASVSIAAAASSKAEGQAGTTAYTFTVTRTGDTSVAHTAGWAVTGSGTNAASAADFVGGVLPTGTVSFAAGETSKTITVNVAADSTIEADEGFTVTLSSPSTGLTIGTGTATGTILNDDASVSLAATSASQSEGQSGGTSYTFTATRTGDTSVAHSAVWAVTGSGTNPVVAADFVGGVLPSGTVSFAAGETSKTITVNVAGDATVEADEGFTITLSNPSTGVVLGTSTATGTIINDDSAGPTTPSISGVVYHWKSHALLSGVTVSAETASSGSTSTALQFRDVRTDISGNVLVDLWGNGASGVGNFGADLTLATGITASFQSSLPADWTVLQNSGTGSLSLAGFGLTSVSGPTKVGTLTFTKSSAATPFSVSLQAGEYGTLSATPLNLASLSDVTGADGGFQIDLGAATYTVDASRGVSDVGRAITSADALAALKLAVGLNPNSDPDGDGPLQPMRVSPYQFLAADVNNSGTITSVDALNILKMAVRLADAPQAEWQFLREQDTFWNAGTSSYSVTRSAVPNAELPMTMQIDSAITQNLVGVLTGDVNGSWRPLDGNGNALAEGSYPELPDSYLVALGSTLAVPTDLWGI